MYAGGPPLSVGCILVLLLLLLLLLLLNTDLPPDLIGWHGMTWHGRTLAAGCTSGCMLWSKCYWSSEPSPISDKNEWLQYDLVS